MNKRTLSLLFCIVLFGGGIALAAFLGGGTENIVLTPGTAEQVLVEVQQNLSQETIPVRLEVEGVVYQISVEPGSSVYDVMVQTRETSDLSFKGNMSSGLGFFVEEINGMRQNPRTGEYWIYYVNGQKAEVGISMYNVRENDIISWKYESEE